MRALLLSHLLAVLGLGVAEAALPQREPIGAALSVMLTLPNRDVQLDLGATGQNGATRSLHLTR